MKLGIDTDVDRVVLYDNNGESALAGHSMEQSPRFCVTFHNKLLFFYGEELSPRPTPKPESIPYRLSATVYSIYSQLPSISGCHLHLHP
jgi:hypothetical protein